MVRPDWTLFRNMGTLGQKAGVPQGSIPKLVVKELTDNALDAAGTCRYGRTQDGGLYVEDDGDGLPGTDGDEPLLFFCVHDADGPGTMIYQTLQEGTRARPGRRVEIVNLGLDPAEAIDMALPAEEIEAKGRRPVATYIDDPWREWLQTHRVELNAMDTPTFLGVAGRENGLGG